MRNPRKSIEEQYALVIECRSSGLSDQQWCMQHDIKPGTFYNWVKRLRQKACYDIPAAIGRDALTASVKYIPGTAQSRSSRMIVFEWIHSSMIKDGLL